ncbi:MAG: PDZ domain-containing protein [Planctomycetota bacterium]|jgi:hypothetical protein
MHQQRARAPGFGPTVTVALLLAWLAVAPARGQVLDNGRFSRTVRPDLPTASELARVRIDPALLRLVEDLDADSYGRRQEAMQQILEDWEDPLQTLAVLERQLLTTEQRHRLLTVVRAQLLETPRGALGISMLPSQPMQRGAPIEVVVTELIPGLPAERLLQRDDRIWRVDGKELFQSDDLLQLVQKKKPGESVTLSIRRVKRDENGEAKRDQQDRRTYEEVEVEITLGSAEQLVNPATGGRPQRSPVVIQRERNAEAAVDRYSRSQPVPIRADFTGVEASSMEVGWTPADGNLSSPLRRLIDTLEGAPDDLVIERDMREQWQMTMQWLGEQWRRGDLSQQDQEDLRRAIRLVAELLDRKP